MNGLTLYNRQIWYTLKQLNKLKELLMAAGIVYKRLAEVRLGHEPRSVADMRQMLNDVDYNNALILLDMEQDLSLRIGMMKEKDDEGR